MADIIVPRLVDYDARWKQQVHRGCMGTQAPSAELVLVAKGPVHAMICKKCRQMWVFEGIGVEMAEWEGYDPGSVRIVPVNGRVLS